MYGNAPIKPATVTFVDIAGLVTGASQGEGLGNQFLSHIRNCNAIVQVVRAFEDNNVQYVDNNNDTKKDIETINTELVLADISTLDNRRSKLEKEAKSNPKLKSELNALEEAYETLNEGIPLFQSPVVQRQSSIIQSTQLITTKPVIYLFNIGEGDLKNEDKKQRLLSLVEPNQALFVCAKLEDELRSLDEDDQRELLASYGQKESGLVQLIQAAYDILGLQSFLTVGEKEVRAWTIAKDTTALQAAGVIHSDFERGFIAAEIVNYQDLIKAGSFQSAKAGGKVRLEGKAYIMKPDDVVQFKFNV